MGTLFSPGKLLLTSEYVVLDGALALAIPTKLGQDLIFEEIEDGKCIVTWEGFHQNIPWLNAKIDYNSWHILETNLSEAAHFLIKVLQAVQSLSIAKFKGSTSYHLQTNLQFPANYGLGSSSTLMNNLANWANIDAFILNDMSLGGSGYDIAVAQKNSPILFSTKNKLARSVEEINYNPSFRKDLVFVHLNQKQNSREGISLYKSKEKSEKLIDELSQITRNVLSAKSLTEFSDLMILHEQLLSSYLQIPTTKEKYFADCPVFIKSLGAWGGDFILTSKFVDYKKYFESKGFTTIIDWGDLIN